MDDELRSIDIPEDQQNLQHYGVGALEGAPGRGSGRYPLGSGEAAYQRQKNFRTTYRELSKGMTQQQIAEFFQFKNTSELRSRISKNKNDIDAYEISLAKKLKDKGMSTTAIAVRMYGDPKKESTVRNRLKQAEAYETGKFAEISKALKDQVDKDIYLDVGKGTELNLGISDDRLKKVLNQMEREGYKVHPYIQVEQYGTQNGEKTTIKVLTKDGVSDRDIYQHLDEVKPAGFYMDNDVDKVRKFEPPASIDGKRVYIRYAEDGGTKKDGVIELRPGVEDLGLGAAHYAQVRIAVDGKSYLKGMALYSDNIPEGYDVVFNTNKHRGTPMHTEGDVKGVLKELKTNKDGTIDISNPFGASIKTEDQLQRANESEGALRRQRHYIGADGEEHLSAINIVNEEGSWDNWSRNISAQMLSKQPAALAKRQLDLTYMSKQEQLNDILSLTNPTVKKKLLLQFADKCDSDAVHLKAYGFPGQVSKVILPIDSLKDTECYCPEFETGTRVALIRFPHAGRFEIPDLVVNNNQKEGKKILGQAIDAIGINAHVAEHLSGADFDGDTVVVIPNNNGDIKTEKKLRELRDFDPKAAYPERPGMKVMTEENKQRHMGVVTNLITDMTVANAPLEDIAKAVKHSMVVIDSAKHRLDWQRSEKENDILELKRKYQQHADDDGYGGSTTLLTRAKSPIYINQRRFKRIDPETGEKIYEDTLKLNQKGQKIFEETGEIDYQRGLKTEKTSQMANTKDARTLISKYNSQSERVYANYANQMKQLALTARKEAVATPLLKRNPEAKDIYAAEVASLTAKLRESLRNKPLERMAQRLANVEVEQHLYDNPEIKDKPGDVKKLKGRTLQYMRERTGANKKKVFFTDAEWKAVQSGAVSDSFLKQLLDNADDAHVKQLAMPKERLVLTGARKARVESMLERGYTQNEVAKMLDISVSSVKDVAKKMR